MSYLQGLFNFFYQQLFAYVAICTLMVFSWRFFFFLAFFHLVCNHIINDQKKFRLPVYKRRAQKDLNEGLLSNEARTIVIYIEL